MMPPLVLCSLTSPPSPLPSFPPAFLLSLALPLSQLHELLFSCLDMTVFLALSVLPARYALPTSQIVLLGLQSSADHRSRSNPIPHALGTLSSLQGSVSLATIAILPFISSNTGPRDT